MHDRSSAGTEAHALHDSAMANVTRLSAVDTVRGRILLAIELGLLAPGQRLPPERAFAEGLDVSPITARRALESLVLDAVVERRRGRGGGTFISAEPGTVTDSSVGAFRADERAVHRLIDERLLMESAVVHAAALNATDAEIEHLEGLVQLGAKSPSWASFHAVDRQFHTAVATASGLAAAPTYLANYHSLLQYYLPYPIEHLRQSSDQHAELVDAFRRRDPVRAVEITRAHIEALHEEMFVGLTPTEANRPGPSAKPRDR